MNAKLKTLLEVYNKLNIQEETIRNNNLFDPVNGIKLTISMHKNRHTT
jgi:hypothetical protein